LEYFLKGREHFTWFIHIQDPGRYHAQLSVSRRVVSNLVTIASRKAANARLISKFL
jgi:hypothetical protein